MQAEQTLKIVTSSCTVYIHYQMTIRRPKNQHWTTKSTVFRTCASL